MEELLANHEFDDRLNEKKIDLNVKIAKLIDADKVFYNDTTNLAKAIGIPEKELCFTCSSGDYTSLGMKPKFRSREDMKGGD
jgi:amidophosphoribosyltransferase